MHRGGTIVVINHSSIQDIISVVVMELARKAYRMLPRSRLPKLLLLALCCVLCLILLHNIRANDRHVLNDVTCSLPRQGEIMQGHVTDKRKMLIYECMDFRSGCSGWSDRQKFLVSMFLLALVTGRQFGVLMTMPCDIRQYYEPNRYNWTVDKDEVMSLKPRLINQRGNFTNGDFNQENPEDVLLVHGNWDFFPNIAHNPLYRPLLPGWARGGYAHYFHHGWNTLMKPVPRIQLQLNQFLDSVDYYISPRPLVGLHLRMGRNPSNPKEPVVFMNVSQLAPIWREAEKHVRNGSRLFVASDSEEVRRLSRQRFGHAHHDSGGTIMHVGKQRRDRKVCEGFEGVVLDQLILSHCPVLYITGRDFGRRAAMMGGEKVKELYKFVKGKPVRWPL